MEVDKIIKFDLSEIIGKDLEQFFDFLSFESVGHECLMDISYSVVGEDNGLIEVRVTGLDETGEE